MFSFQLLCIYLLTPHFPILLFSVTLRFFLCLSFKLMQIHLKIQQRIEYNTTAKITLFTSSAQVSVVWCDNLESIIEYFRCKNKYRLAPLAYYNKKALNSTSWHLYSMCPFLEELTCNVGRTIYLLHIGGTIKWQPHLLPIFIAACLQWRPQCWCSFSVVN